MVSEDSQEFGRLTVIHRLGDLRDRGDAWHRQVQAQIHQANDLRELLEVVPLRSSQRVLEEERDDHVPQIRKTRNPVSGQILPMVVTPVVDPYLAASEEADKALEHISAGLTLYHHERWLDLPAELGLGVLKERTAETALSIDEPDDPSRIPESFLLVFRTTHIVTAGHVGTLQTTCNGQPDDE